MGMSDVPKYTSRWSVVEHPLIVTQASKYLLDPLTAPEPSQETGPGTHFYPSKSSATSVASDTRSEVPKRKSVASVDVRPKSSSPKNAYPSPPASASPRANNRPARRQEAFSNFDGAFSPRQSTAQSSAIGTSTADTSEVPTSSTGRRRTSSLTQRYPGDQSHRPLDIIRKDTKAANRAPHLKKKQLVGPDTIDSLDTVGGGKYHHEGPYDATLLARNVEFMNSPVEAVSSTNEQTLRATPREKVLDSLRKHRPLDGVATVPSGMTDREGRIFHYEEGTDLMIEEGNYKRWPGVVRNVSIMF